MAHVSVLASPVASDARPRAAPLARIVSLPINAAGLGAAILALFFARDIGLVRIEASLLACFAYAGVVLTAEVMLLRTPWAASAGLDFARRGFNMARIATKLLGLYATFGVIGFLYWLFPEYRGANFQPFWIALRELAPLAAILAIPYVAFVDRAMREPEDGLYWAGRALLGDHDASRLPVLRQYALGWIIKAFFLPLMFGALATNTETLLRGSMDLASLTFAQFFALASVWLFWADVLIACVGYACALRLFDTHIRSSEPTAWGWAVCLMCYPPFQTVFMAQYLAYTAPNAIRLLSDTPTLQVIWGVAALGLLAIYTLATLVFGCRFSNITHRGVIVSGPYRFTKHPAYVAKNLYWWLLHMPLLTAGSAADAFRYSLLLLGINLVYFLRARTEERHMSHDPTYVAYAAAMNERSIFAGLARRVPSLRYRAPEHAQVGSSGVYKGLA